MPGLLDLVLEQSPGVTDPQAENDTPQQPQQDQAPRLPSLYDAVTRPEVAPTYGNLATARVNAENETPSVGRAVAQRLPFIRSAFNFADAIQTDNAQARIASNQGTESDYSRVASGERLRQFHADMTPGENLRESLMDIPALLIETRAAGGLLGTRFASPEIASLGTRAANFFGQSAGTAAIMGNWLPRWAENNQAQGRRATDVRGLPPAFGHEVATMAVLGSLGHFGDAVGANNIGGFLQRGLTRVGIGMAEQAGLDVATSAIQNSVQNVFHHDLGLDSGYGLVGQLARGEGHEALANATQQALTFAVFAGIHEANRTPIMREYSAQMREMNRAGVPAAEAGRRMSDVTSMMQVASERDMTRQEARTLLQNIPEGPARAYGEALARTIPEEGRGSRAFLNQPMRQTSLSDLTGRGERYGSETFTDQPRRTGSLADLTKPTPLPPPEPKHPIQVLSERVGQLDSARAANDAKIKALPKKGGPEFEKLTAESMRLFKESQSTKAELASEMAKGRPQQATLEARQGVQGPKTIVEPSKPAQEALVTPGTAIPRPENAWHNTGTKFRETPQGLEFTGRNGKNYGISERFIKPGETEGSPHGGVVLTVHDTDGKKVGSVGLFKNKDGNWNGESIDVEPGSRDTKERRTGVAAAMYDYIAHQGEHVVPAPFQNDKGKAFWARNREMADKAKAEPLAKTPVETPTEKKKAIRPSSGQGRPFEQSAGPGEPPIPEGHIRHWNGGGSDWYTTDRAYAEKFATGERASGPLGSRIAKPQLFYVDVPASHSSVAGIEHLTGRAPNMAQLPPELVATRQTAPLAMSPAEKMLAKGKEAAAGGKSVEQPKPVDPRSIFQEFAQRAITDTGDIRAIMRDAPGFPNREEMFKSFNLNPQEQQVLNARFSDSRPTFQQVGDTMGVKRQRIQQIEKEAIKKIVGPDGESLYKATVVAERKARTNKAGAAGDVIADAVVRGELDSARGKKPIQDVVDKVTSEHEEAITNLAIRREQAIKDGATKEEIKALDDLLITKGVEFDADVKREIARRLRRERGRGLTPQESSGPPKTTPAIPGSREPVGTSNPAPAGLAATSTREQASGAQGLSPKPKVERAAGSQEDQAVLARNGMSGLRPRKARLSDGSVVELSGIQSGTPREIDLANGNTVDARVITEWLDDAGRTVWKRPEQSVATSVYRKMPDERVRTDAAKGVKAAQEELARRQLAKTPTETKRSIFDDAKAIGVRLYDQESGDFSKRLYDLGNVDTKFLDDNYGKLGLHHNEAFRYLGQVYETAKNAGLTREQINRKIDGAIARLNEYAQAIREKGEAAGIPKAAKVADFYEMRGRDMAEEARRHLLSPEATTTPASQGPDFGRPVTDAERGVLPGGGQANAGEAPIPQKPQAAIANAAIDAWREKEGLTPILSDARRADPVVWDRAMARLTADPAAATKLIDDIVDNNRRATTAEDNALLLQRTVAVRNERTRNMLQLVDAYNQRVREGGKAKMTPETAARIAELERAEADLGTQVDRVDKASRLSGSEWGRAGRWRQMLLKDDFTLAGMLRSAEVAAGRPLSEAERTEITTLNTKIAELEKKLQEAEASGKAQPDKPSNEGFAVDQARKEFTRKIVTLKESNEPLTTKALRLVGETFNLPRSIMASIDFPLLRQGHLAMLSHPIRTMQAIPEMFRAAMKEGNAARSEYELLHRANHPLYERGGLDLTTREGDVGKREEGFLSRMFSPGAVEAVQKNSPALGALMKLGAFIPRASERSYQTVMNRIRADSFDAMVSSLGRDGKITDAELKVIGNYVNVMTGRGPLGVTGEKAAKLLNQVFFAPRWTASRFQFVAGQPLLKNFGESAPRARKLVAQEYAKVLAGLGTALGLAAGFGATIDWNPTSSGFGQMKIGNTFLDLTGGLRRPTTLISRLWTGHKTDAFGVPIPIRGPNVPHGGQTGADLIGNYLRSSLAPVPGAGVNLAAGSDLGGKPSTAGGELGNLATPLFAKDVYQAMSDLGVEKGTAVSLLTLMGLSTQTRTQDMQPKPPVTAASRREQMVRSQIDMLRNAIRGRRNVGGRVVQGPAPVGQQRQQIQSQIDRLVGQLP